MSDLDRYFDGFGRQLTAARPRRTRRVLAFGGGIGTAATAAVAATLVLGGGPAAPVDAMAAVREAMTLQDGEILVMRIKYTTDAGDAAVLEQVVASNPKRWRSSSTSNGIHEEDAFKPGERAALENGKLDIQTGVDENHLYSTGSTFLGIGADPEDRLRSYVASGEMVDAGEVESGGRTVRRFTWSQGAGHLDVDPETFTPLGGSSIPATDGVRYHFTFERFEKLPDNAENAKLLEIQVPPGTIVVRRPVEYREPRKSAARRTARGR